MSIKRTESVTETTTFLRLRITAKEERQDWCLECDAEASWVELEEAIEFFGNSSSMQIGRVHISGGRVCLRSLAEWIKQRVVS